MLRLAPAVVALHLDEMASRRLATASAKICGDIKTHPTPLQHKRLFSQN